jgi:hypothetical protein
MQLWKGSYSHSGEQNSEIEGAPNEQDADEQDTDPSNK